jgi:hypothetical protein
MVASLEEGAIENRPGAKMCQQYDTLEHANIAMTFGNSREILYT